MIEKIYGEKLSPLVDLMIHEYDERYGLRLFEKFNPYDMNKIIES